MKKVSFLDKLEADIVAMKQAEEKRQALQPEDKSFATAYYHQALGAYMTVIAILRKYLNNPLALVSLVTGNNEDAQALEQAINKIDSLRFVPLLFHPLYSETRREFIFRADQRCYLLAKTIRFHVKQLQDNDTDSGLVEIFKKKYGHKIAKVLHSLDSRIHRFEYNANNADVYDLMDQSEGHLQQCLEPFKAAAHYEPSCQKYKEFVTSLEKAEEHSPKLGRLIRSIQQLSLEAADQTQAQKEAEKLIAELESNKALKDQLNTDFSRLKRMIREPHLYKQPKEPEKITAWECKNALQSAIQLGERALELQCEYAQFLRDEPQPFIARAQKRDSYPALLKEHFANSQDVIDKYHSGTDARQIQLYLSLSQHLDNVSRTIENAIKCRHVYLEEDEVASLIAKTKALTVKLSESANYNEAIYRSIKDQIRGAKPQDLADNCFLSRSQKLFDHFATFAKYDPNGKHLRKNKQIMDRLSKEFYDEFAPKWQLMAGAQTMAGGALKCIILPLIDELNAMVTKLKLNFEKTKGHETYPGYKMVLTILAVWPVFPVEPQVAALRM